MRDLLQEAEGKRRLAKPCCMDKAAARCWTCSGRRLKVKVTSNFSLFTNLLFNLGRSGVSQARGTLPHGLPCPSPPAPGLWHRVGLPGPRQPSWERTPLTWRRSPA